MNFKRFKKNLPDAYQELAFITNSGTQHIDTGLKGSDLADCEIEIVMKNNSTLTTDYNLNGTYLSGSVAQLGMVATSGSECRSVINFGFADSLYTTGLSLSEFHTIYATNGLQKVDNTVVGTFNFGTLNNGSFLLFARTDPIKPSGITVCAGMHLKSFTVKRNNQYIRNMIPAKRKSDNTFGLYDTANDVFYTNQGTGDFTGGTVVEPTWHDIPHYIMGTSTDTLTTLPADVYANDTTATVGLKGNMSQSGTPSPTTPIQPQECGELETVGDKAGQYKIPILSANTTTNVYLGEVESTRKIRKYEFTGEENISDIGDYYNTNVSVLSIAWSATISTTGGFQINNGGNRIWAIKSYFSSYATATDFKTYLQQQYTAGTPVTVWYVLAAPTTGIVNEPLRKIGTYADEVSGITIPTIAGANTLSVDTTLQPSEVTVNYKGWHPVADVHERENGAWT